MARSHAIWVVSDKVTGVPKAAFTVKHELATWLYKYENPQTLSYLVGWKLSDGYHLIPGQPLPAPLPLDLLFLRGEGEKTEENRIKRMQRWNEWG